MQKGWGPLLIRYQSPKLRFLARDWGRGGDGYVCERPLGGSAFYLPIWVVPVNLSNVPTLFSLAPLPLGSSLPSTKKRFRSRRDHRRLPCAVTREIEAQSRAGASQGRERP